MLFFCLTHPFAQVLITCTMDVKKTLMHSVRQAVEFEESGKKGKWTDDDIKRLLDALWLKFQMTQMEAYLRGDQRCRFVRIVQTDGKEATVKTSTVEPPLSRFEYGTEIEASAMKELIEFAKTTKVQMRKKSS